MLAANRGMTVKDARTGVGSAGVGLCFGTGRTHGGRVPSRSTTVVRPKNGTMPGMNPEPILDVVFFRTEFGHEPVREWLREFPRADKRLIGADLKTVQFGWPIGMPIVRKLAPNLWELRSRLDQRIARILFTVVEHRVVLLHGFIKKSQKTPQPDLELAKRRLALINT